MPGTNAPAYFASSTVTKSFCDVGNQEHDSGLRGQDQPAEGGGSNPVFRENRELLHYGNRNHLYQVRFEKLDQAGNTITVPLTSCLTGLD